MGRRTDSCRVSYGTSEVPLRLRRAARTVGDARAMTMAPAEVAPASSVRREALSSMDKALLTSKGICAVTYFRGDATSARCALAERLRLVLEANPWLAGRLVQHKRVVCLEWHEAPAAEALAAAAAVALHAPPGGCGLRYGCTYQQLHSAIVDTPLEVPIAARGTHRPQAHQQGCAALPPLGGARL